jgi:anti-anti-sigma regulatory factor
VQILDEERHDCHVLTLRGRLDRSNAPALHRDLLVALATHQRPMVFDVGQLDVADPLTLTLFQGVGTQARFWPGTPVFLCRADPATVDSLRRLRVDRVVPLCSSLSQALDASRGNGYGHLPVSGDVLALPVLPPAARAAREFVRTGCRGYSEDTVETAVLLVNEMVTYSLQHAHRDLSVLLSLSGPTVRIAVADDDPRLPHTVARSRSPQANLDLRLLNAFTDNWGALPTASGKVIWSLLQD